MIEHSPEEARGKDGVSDTVSDPATVSPGSVCPELAGRRCLSQEYTLPSQSNHNLCSLKKHKGNHVSTFRSRAVCCRGCPTQRAKFQQVKAVDLPTANDVILQIHQPQSSFAHGMIPVTCNAEGAPMM